MTVKDLSPNLLATLKKTRYDRIVEKHEGPATWSWELPDESRKEEMKKMYGDRDMGFDIDAHADFLEIGGVQVLLPVDNDHHENMTFLHHFFSEDRQKLVLYIKDTTYDDDVWGAGFVAICDKYPNEPFYLATFYHEWYIIDYDPMAEKFKVSA